MAKTENKNKPNNKVKVYELAKSLDIKSMFLMDKIRKEWNLPIKSHMEVLSPEMVKKIQDNFLSESKKAQKEQSKTKKTKVKKITKKTVAASKTTTKKTSSASLTKAKKEPKSPTTSTKEKKESLVKKAIPQEKVESPPVKSRIIRRRKSEPPSSLKAEAMGINLDPQSGATTLEQKTQGPKSLSKSIRSDLVSVKKSDSFKDIFVDEESQNKKAKDQENKAQKKSFSEKEPVTKFNSTDFRKREIIFQPKKKRIVVGNFKKTEITTPKLHKRILKIHGEMNIDTICKKIGIKKSALFKKLKSEGIDTKNLKSLDFDTIALVAPDFGFEAKNVQKTEETLLQTMAEDSQKTKKDLISKPPVVTIMGHVDHGKTTLLDTIRKTKVVEAEAGGITQHIGAYSVEFNNKPISFIDTPGHEAFTAMRARGAKVTDIAIIVVAADDGVMPQTAESINHAKAAGIPIIIAMTKMDSPSANIDKIKQQMSEHNIVPEDWGGEISFIPVAALKGEGIKELLEQIHLVAEMQELVCDKKALAQGVVLEARMEKGRGCVASLIVQNGTLKSGDTIIAGQAVGRVRQMKNDNQKIVKESLPGFPVEVIGLSELPEAGDSFNIVENEKALRDLKSLRQEQGQVKKEVPLLSVEELLEKTYLEDKNKEFKVVLKTDVRGSLEALKTSLEKLKGEHASLKIIHSGTGPINESDILLASTTQAFVLGFNIRPDNKASSMAKQKSIEIKTYSIIYELLDDVKKMMLGLLDPDFVEEELGQAEVRDVFSISKLGTVAGSYVTSGKVQRNALIRLVRDGQLVYKGKIQSLRRFKDDAKEVSSGLECGISIENFNDIKPKDVLEIYLKKEVAKTEI